MRGASCPSADSAFLMHVEKGKAESLGPGRLAPLFRGVRTERFTYAVAEDGRWCLYDDREDPYQLQNRIDDRAYAGIADELDGVMFEWLRRARDPFPLNEARTRRSALSSKNS
jgi:hypothetical protein